MYGEVPMVTKVVDLSIDELKTLIQDVVTQTLIELFRDPDMDLPLREDFKSDLQNSLNAISAGGETITAENVAAKLGVNW